MEVSDVSMLEDNHCIAMDYGLAAHLDVDYYCWMMPFSLLQRD